MLTGHVVRAVPGQSVFREHDERLRLPDAAGVAAEREELPVAEAESANVLHVLGVVLAGLPRLAVRRVRQNVIAAEAADRDAQPVAERDRTVAFAFAPGLRVRPLHAVGGGDAQPVETDRHEE